jgi:hypothetical protein
MRLQVHAGPAACLFTPSSCMDPAPSALDSAICFVCVETAVHIRGRSGSRFCSLRRNYTTIGPLDLGMRFLTEMQSSSKPRA